MIRRKLSKRIKTSKPYSTAWSFKGRRAMGWFPARGEGALGAMTGGNRASVWSYPRPSHSGHSVFSRGREDESFCVL